MISNYLDSDNDQAINLLSKSCHFNAFQFASRQFTITTNNSSAKFNTIMLYITSKIMSKLINKDPNLDQHHIDIQDDQNIIGKLEQVYQGESIKFNDSEIIILNEIVDKLGIKVIFLQENGKLINNSILVCQDEHLFIDQKLLITKTETYFFKSFTIQTKKNEYKCNVFGILSSKVIRNFLNDHSKDDRYIYDFDDENNEFQFICSIFNYQSVDLTKDNVEIIKEIATDLEIECVLSIIEKFINESEKVSKSIDDQQNIIDSIDELFDLLYHLKVTPIDSVVKTIKESRWSKTKENICELTAFILQVVQQSIEIHQYVIDLLLELDQLNELKTLLPLVIDRSFQLLIDESKSKTEYNLIFPFVYQLNKRNIISKQRLAALLQKCPIINSYFISWFFAEFMETNLDFNSINFVHENKNDDHLYSPKYDRNNMKLFYPCDPNKIEIYKIMRDNGEDDNEITKALREDDIDTFQAIVTQKGENFLSETIKPTMFEPFDNENIRYINYAAAHGSIKCFKYILLNNQKIDDQTFNMAIIGGNNELIRIVDNEKVVQRSINKMHLMKLDNKNEIIKNALIQCIKSHKNDLFDWIIEKNLSIINTNDLYKLAFESTVNGNPHTLVQIIDNGFNLNNYSSNPNFLEITSQKGFYTFLTFLLNLINFKESINPIRATSFGNINIFKLFDKKMNKDEIETAFYNSVKCGYFDIAEYITKNYQLTFDNNKSINTLKCCFDNNSKETLNFVLDLVKDKLDSITVNTLYDLLFIAFKSLNIEAIKLSLNLIKKNNPNNDLTSFFITSAYFSFKEVMDFMIEQKYNINWADIINRNCFFRSDDEIYELIMNNIDSDLKNIMLNSIDIAIGEINIPFVKFLLKHNAPIENALVKAVYTRNLNMVNLILENNSDPSYINKISNNKTALLASVKINNVPILKRLLSIEGIDPNIYNSDFITPLIYSVFLHNSQIFDLLFDFYGNEINNQKWQLELALDLLFDLNFNFKNKNNLEYNFVLKKLQLNKNPFSDYDYNPTKILLKIINLDCIDPNLRFKNGTLLYFACEIQSIELVSALLKNEKIDVNLNVPNGGETPLIMAIKTKNIPIINLLINHPKININQCDYMGCSPLFYATKLNDESIFDLIAKNEKFDQKESNINLAFQFSKNEITKKLLSMESLDINYVPYKDFNISSFKPKTSNAFYETKNNDSPLINSILNHDNILFDLIIQHPSFVKNKEQLIEAVHAAISKSNIDIFNKLFELLKEFNIDINSPILNGKTPLLESIHISNDLKMISCILNHPDFQIEKNDILQAFIDTYKSVNSYEKFMFNHTMFKINLLYDFDCEHDHLIDNKINEEGSSFLKSMYYEICQKKRINPNKLDSSGIYPLQSAIQNNSYILALCLINSKEFLLNQMITIANETTTYVHLAAAYGRSKILETILSKDPCYLNKINSKGDTPLLVAARFRKIECIKVLFKYKNLDFSYRNNGKDAIDIIKDSGKNSTEIIRMKNKDEYLSRLIHLLTSNNEPAEKKNLNTLKKTFQPIRGFGITKIDPNKLKEVTKKSMDELNKQKNQNISITTDSLISNEKNKEENKLTSTPKNTLKFQIPSPIMQLNKKKFEIHNESFSEKPDSELQMLLDKLRKKTQNSSRKISLQKRKQNEVYENSFDDEEIDLYSNYLQQINDQKQFLFLQKQQQQWFQMIQMNNQYQAQINIQMMNQYQSMLKKQQRSKRKK